MKGEKISENTRFWLLLIYNLVVGLTTEFLGIGGVLLLINCALLIDHKYALKPIEYVSFYHNFVKQNYQRRGKLDAYKKAVWRLIVIVEIWGHFNILMGIFG